MSGDCSACGPLRRAVYEAENRCRALVRRMNLGPETHSARAAKGELPGAREALHRARRILTEHRTEAGHP